MDKIEDERVYRVLIPVTVPVPINRVLILPIKSIGSKNSEENVVENSSSKTNRPTISVIPETRTEIT